MAVTSPTSPKYRGISGGYPTPSEPTNGICNDFQTRDLEKQVMGVYVGWVVDSWPASNSCLVQTAMQGKVMCSYPSLGSANVSGVNTVSVPPVGGMVLFAKSYESDTGYIISGATAEGTSIEGSLPSTHVWGEYNSTFKELAAAETFDCEEIAMQSGGIISQQYPVPGEASAFTEGNVGWIHGKLYYRTQAGPLASITLNSIDDFVDFVAHNFQLFTSSFKLRSICDYGKSNLEILTGSSIGAFSKDQDKAHRIKISSGWLAAGISSQANRQGGIQSPVSDIWHDELGIYSIRSTVGSWMQKVNGIFVPKKRYEPDDPNGLGDKNVFPNSLREGFNILPKGVPDAAFGCQARDYVAWQTAGRYRFERFAAYPNDWEKPTVSSTGLIGGWTKQYAPFSPVRSVKSEIDGEPQDYVEIRNGEAFCGTLPDGSVVLRDAWGSSIELRGGKIVITNMKDTEIVSGGSTVIMSGDDVIVKSKNSVEVNSTNESVRIRSGKHTLIDAKNGAVQVTALNSPDPNLDKTGDDYSPTGITFKSNSQITSAAPHFSVVSDNTISMMGSSDSGGPLIFCKGSNTINWSSGTHFIYSGDLSSGRQGMATFSNGVIRCGQQFHAEGEIHSKSMIYTEGNLQAGGNLAVNGFIASDTNGSTVQQLLEPLELPSESEKEMYAQFGDSVNSIIQQDTIDNGRGKIDKEGYDKIGFRYRTTSQYDTAEHVWFESFWQRQYADALSAWDQSGDVDKDKEMVYPGKDHFAGKQSFVKYKEQNVYADGTPKPADEQSKQGGEFSKVSISEMRF